MSTIETERGKMPEGTTEEKKKAEMPTDDEIGSVNRKDYLQTIIESKVKEAQGENLRRPVWSVLDDPGVKAIVERRAFLEKLQQKSSLEKYRQELQHEWDERKKQRQERLEQKMPQEVRPGFTSRVANFFRERTEKLIEFLSGPNTEVERLRQIERQSSEELKEVFKGAGTRLRGASGFLKGLASSTFKGLGGMSTNIGERLESKPVTSNRPASGTPAPGPGSI